MFNSVALIGLVLAVVQPQDLTQRVHDFASLLPEADAQELESLCRRVEVDTTVQFAIVTVRSLEGKTVDEYAHELFNDWGIGRRDLNNGVLLLVAPNERRMRIEVGTGLESCSRTGGAARSATTRSFPLSRREISSAASAAGQGRSLGSCARIPMLRVGCPARRPSSFACRGAMPGSPPGSRSAPRSY